MKAKRSDGAVLIWGVFAATLTVFFLLPLARILAAGLVEDDAFYYLKIATNLAAGRGSTFDGLSPTNGYHPLWMLVLMPVYRVCGSRPELAFRVACLLGVAGFLIAGLLAHALLRRLFRDPAPAAFAAVVLAFLTLFSSNYGLETPWVLLLTNAILLHLACRDPLRADASGKEEWGLGILLALVFLARLDMVFLGMAVGGSLLLRAWRETWRPGEILGKATRLFLPCLLLPAPYLAWNLATFGRIAPISGTLKSSFPHPGPYLYILGRLGPHVLVSLAVGVALIVQGWVRGSRPEATADRERAGPVLGALRILSVLVMAQLGYALLFEKWGFTHWQLAPCFLLGALGAGWALSVGLRAAARLLPGRWMRLTPGLVLVLAAGALAAGCWLRLGPTTGLYTSEWKAARWARANLPPDAVVVAKGDAGLFSYFSGLHVINISDGLVNDFAYQEVLRRQELAHYLTQKGAGWLFLTVNPARIQDGRYGLQARGYLHQVLSEEIVVDLRRIIFRSDTMPVAWGSGEVFLAILPVSDWESHTSPRRTLSAPLFDSRNPL